MTDRKPQMFPNCFIGCPYLLQCGTMVARGADSCSTEIKDAIPGTTKLEADPTDKVKAFDQNGQHIATVNRGQITSQLTPTA